MPSTTDSLVRIFISYGRLDASEFVDRLERDLRRAGFEVWRDKSELRYGAAWDAQIADALAHSDVVLPVLSSHAVRGGRRPVPEGDE